MPRFTHTHESLLSPPPDVLAEVDAAWERAQGLFAGELELHFELRPAGVCADLRVPDGDVWEPLCLTEALALACGDVELVVDERSHALTA